MHLMQSNRADPTTIIGILGYVHKYMVIMKGSVSVCCGVMCVRR